VVAPDEGQGTPDPRPIVEVVLLRPDHGIPGVDPVRDRRGHRVRAPFAQPVVEVPDGSAADIIAEVRPTYMGNSDVELADHAVAEVVVRVRQDRRAVGQVPAQIGRNVVPDRGEQGARPPVRWRKAHAGSIQERHEGLAPEQGVRARLLRRVLHPHRVQVPFEPVHGPPPIPGSPFGLQSLGPPQGQHVPLPGLGLVLPVRHGHAPRRDHVAEPVQIPERRPERGAGPPPGPQRGPDPGLAEPGCVVALHAVVVHVRGEPGPVVVRHGRSRERHDLESPPGQGQVHLFAGGHEQEDLVGLQIPGVLIGPVLHAADGGVAVEGQSVVQERLADPVKLGARHLGQRVREVVDLALGQQGKALVAVDPLEVDQGLLLLVAVELPAVVLFEEVAVGQGADLSRELPLTGQELAVLDRETAAGLVRRLDVPSSRDAAQRIGPPIVDPVRQHPPEVGVPLVVDLHACSGAPLAVVVQQQGAVCAFGGLESEHLGQPPPGLQGGAPHVVVPDPNAADGQVRSGQVRSQGGHVQQGVVVDLEADVVHLRDEAAVPQGSAARVLARGVDHEHPGRGERDLGHVELAGGQRHLLCEEGVLGLLAEPLGPHVEGDSPLRAVGPQNGLHGQGPPGPQVVVQLLALDGSAVLCQLHVPFQVHGRHGVRSQAPGPILSLGTVGPCRCPAHKDRDAVRLQVHVPDRILLGIGEGPPQGGPPQEGQTPCGVGHLGPLLDPLRVQRRVGHPVPGSEGSGVPGQGRILGSHRVEAGSWEGQEEDQYCSSGSVQDRPLEDIRVRADHDLRDYSHLDLQGQRKGAMRPRTQDLIRCTRTDKPRSQTGSGAARGGRVSALTHGRPRGYTVVA